ncbi:biotin transporter BioY [Hominifimenecus sp. rT4P-3]|uniref:biotin transporter BioY n=1 Tax=Hominifimenecus sp. rT4P-3 TaxID=3242979 RepID=UPI003DA23B60
MKSQQRLYSLILAALIAAITCILAPFAIPLPMTPVPISLTNLVIFFSLYLIGWKWSLVSYGVYILLGLIGLPVFSGFSGGLGKAAGPTGGYLIGFFFLIIIAGIVIEKYPARPFGCAIGMVLGMAAAYAFGTAWLSYQLKLTFWAGLMTGVFPYLIGDALKIAAALLLGPTLQRAVKRLPVKQSIQKQ